MRNFFVLVVGVGPLAFLCAAEEGFTPLFNGKDLSGWSGDPALWSVENGEIVGRTKEGQIKQNSFLSYGKEFSDFVLRAEVKLRNHNSGIQFRAEQRPDYVVAGYQADVAESNYFGMLYEERKRGFMDYWKAMTPEAQAKTQQWAKQGDWNQFVVTCEGDKVKIELNGHVTCDIVDPSGAKRGVIALQLHAGPPMEVRFRNIEVQEIGAIAQASLLDPSVTAARSRYSPATGVTPRDEQVLLMPNVDATRSEKLETTGARYRVPEGFVVEEVATDELIGSVINMTFDWKGRPVVASESGGMRILIDDDHNGVYESQKSYCEDVKTAMGVYVAGPGDIWVQSKGPEGAGMYRLRDFDGDDTADDVSLVMKSNGDIGEHGPHTILRGPDGFLYVMYGNHSHPQSAVNPWSPSRDLQEDHLLPRYVDPNGHAAHIVAPGGTIQRVDPQTGQWSEIVGGFRNAFDMDINLEGEVFTFDSDMEWDYGLPWYRPIRVVHCIPGGDYGWRTGSENMQSYYIGTLPPVDDVGRGSPVGVCFYYHNTYPDKYQGALFMGDWSRGRIRVVFPEASGATYSGQTVDFVLGEPLNVTDMDVGPDGNLYFTNGGRGTHGGMYRVRYTGPAREKQKSKGIVAALEQPMPRSAWGRAAILDVKEELGRSWAEDLRGAVSNADLPVEQRLRALEILQTSGPMPTLDYLTGLLKDKNAQVRAQAVYLLGTFPLVDVRESLTSMLDDKDPVVLRRTCEALVRAGLDATSHEEPSRELRSALVMLLNHDDRFVRYSAREALQRVHPREWTSAVLSDDVKKRPHGAFEGLVALIFTQRTADQSDAIFAKLAEYGKEDLEDEQLLDYLRVVSLAFMRDAGKDKEGHERADFMKAVGPGLLAKFPHSDWAINRELQVVCSYMQTPGVQEALLAELTPDKTQEDQIHLAYCLRAVKEGWTKEQRAKLAGWFDLGREFGGANSMDGYIENMWQSTLELLPDDERKSAETHKADMLKQRQERAAALLAKIEGEEAKGIGELAQMSFDELADYLEYDPMAYNVRPTSYGEKIFMRSKCVQCHVYGDAGRGGGPDLSTVASRFRRRDILESIMFPSKVVSDQYVAIEVELDDFSTILGMLAGETDDTLTLIDVNGNRKDIVKSTITSRKNADKSVMPEGLLNTMGLNDLVALVQFLEGGSKS